MMFCVVNGLKKAKKIVAASLCSVLLLSAPINKSHALVTGAVGTPMTIVLLMCTTELGALVPMVDEVPEKKWYIAVGAGIGLLVGIVLLDQKDGTATHFSALEEKDALKLKLTSEQTTDFNAEIDEINVLSEEFSKLALQKFGSNQQLSKENLQNINSFYQKQWANAAQRGIISSQSYKVIRAIRMQ